MNVCATVKLFAGFLQCRDRKLKEMEGFKCVFVIYCLFKSKYWSALVCDLLSYINSQFFLSNYASRLWAPDIHCGLLLNKSLLRELIYFLNEKVELILMF